LVQLVCLFTTEPELDSTVTMITKTYDVIYKKLFVLSILDTEELACTFNIDKVNQRRQLPGAMLVHRKKETNTLYTINSLNELIKQECGSLNKDYKVNWEDYSNSILLTSNGTFRVLKTKVYQIVNT